jgi:two-component system response regulator
LRRRQPVGHPDVTSRTDGRQLQAIQNISDLEKIWSWFLSGLVAFVCAAGGAAMNTTSPRVLILEHKPDAQRLILHDLINQKHGDKVELITDGQEGWNRLCDPATDAPDLIAVMLDLNLSSMSGLEVLKRIRGHPKLKNLFVVVMTDSTPDEDIKRCIELGVTSFIKKPITISSFTKVLADSFHDSRAAQRRN